MGSNTFGEIFKITTFGESHGPSIGVVIDGCIAGLEISKEEIQKELDLRSPGGTPYTSPRKEKDQVQILSGVFEGKTTGAPIALLLENQDADSSKYDALKGVYRPGHANFTYLEKYGIFDHRGGGRASARETAARVAAGAVAKKLLWDFYGVEIIAYLQEMGKIRMGSFAGEKAAVLKSPIFCPCPKSSFEMQALIEKVKKEKDSLGGVVACQVRSMPKGLGDPVYRKLDALLAFAMLSIPASKGFEIGLGFEASRKKGSEVNDLFDVDEKGEVFCKTNHAGGVLGGISTGAPLFFRVAFKPPSSIEKPQESVSLKKERVAFALPKGSRHDPCVAIRAVPVVEAMAALCLIDAVFMNQTAKVSNKGLNFFS